ncbi:MAG: DinB family protein [Dehalococcoidia bacterium]
MSATDSVMYSLERNWEMVEAATSGLDEDALTRQPAEQSNSIAWIFGHMNRVTDMFIRHRLQSKPELWVIKGWCQKFGMSNNAGGLGMGQTAEQIAAWVAPAWEVQLGYFEAVKGAAREYISSLTGSDKERRVMFPPEALRREHTVATALGQLVLENVAHGGQIAYLRGFYKGMGWYR